MKSSSFTSPEQLRGTRTRQTKEGRKTEQEDLDLDHGLGQKRTTLKGLGEGADMSDFISFPLLRRFCQNAPCWQRYEGGENRSPQHSPEAADAHHSKSPSAMKWRNLSGDLD